MLVMVGFGAVVVAVAVGWWRATGEVRRAPEGAFAALGTTRSNWENLLFYSAPLAVPLYYLRFRRHLLREAEQATDLMPAWYPDQNDPAMERWFDGRAWTDLVRRRAR